MKEYCQNSDNLKAGDNLVTTSSDNLLWRQYAQMTTVTIFFL